MCVMVRLAKLQALNKRFIYIFQVLLTNHSVCSCIRSLCKELVISGDLPHAAQLCASHVLDQSLRQNSY